MSLFEKLNNKRYDLQEKKINKKLSSNSGGDKKIGTVKPGEVEATKNVIRDKAQQPDLTPSAQKRLAKVDKKIQITDKTVKDFKKNLKNLAKGNTDPNKATMVKGTTDTDLIKGTKATGDEGSFRRNARKTKVTGDVIPKKDLPKTQGVNQADVSKQAKDFTKEIEKKRVKKLAPIDLKKPTERVDLRTVDKKISRKRPSNAPSLADIQKKIDVKNPVVDGKPVKGTVLKVDKGEFKRVKKTSPEGQKILNKQISSDELLGNNNKDKKKNYKKEYKKTFNNNKNKSSKTLFQKLKDIGRSTKRNLGKVHNYLVKDSNFRKTTSKNLTRNIYKNTLRGNTLKNINRLLPGKYKAVVGIPLALYGLSKFRKGAAGGGKGEVKRYDAYERPLGFDTGKKKGEK